MIPCSVAHPYRSGAEPSIYLPFRPSLCSCVLPSLLTSHPFLEFRFRFMTSVRHQRGPKGRCPWERHCQDAQYSSSRRQAPSTDGTRERSSVGAGSVHVGFAAATKQDNLSIVSLGS